MKAAGVRCRRYAVESGTARRALAPGAGVPAPRRRRRGGVGKCRDAALSEDVPAGGAWQRRNRRGSVRGEDQAGCFCRRHSRNSQARSITSRCTAASGGGAHRMIETQ